MPLKQKERQFEWFGLPESKQHPRRARPLRLNESLNQEPEVTISLENIIIIVIGVVLMGVLSFSMGVVKGKRIIANGLHVTTENLPAVTEKPPVVTEKPPVTTAPAINKISTQTTKLETQKSEPIKPSFTVQMVTHTKKTLAEEDVRRLRKKRYKTFVLRSGNYYVVCVGEYHTRKDALQDIDKLREIYKDCFIRRK